MLQETRRRKSPYLLKNKGENYIWVLIRNHITRKSIKTQEVLKKINQCVQQHFSSKVKNEDLIRQNKI